MDKSYTQVFVHIIFSIKDRAKHFNGNQRQVLEKYITGIVQNKNSVLIKINVQPDHVHILMSLNAAIALSELVRDIKANSSKFINKSQWFRFQFNWRDGYGGFSYSKSQLETIKKYIENQDEHHKIKTFAEEYQAFIKAYSIYATE